MPIEIPSPTDTAQDEAAIRAQNARAPSATVTELLEILDSERAEARIERAEWSRAAAVLGLAPYGGAYNPALILPSVQALVASNWEMRRRLSGQLPRFPTLGAAHPSGGCSRGSSLGGAVPQVAVHQESAGPNAEPLVQEATKARFNEAAGTPDVHVMASDDVGPVFWYNLVTLLFGPRLTLEPLGMKYPVEPARLDPDGTLQGKTILTAPAVGANGPVPHPGQERTYVDTETGERIPLNTVR